MKRTTKLVVALWAMFVALPAFSQKGTEQQLEKDANALFVKGEYLKAFPMYSQLVSLYPNHPDYNYKFGACAIYSESDKSKAVKFLNIAVSKNVEDVMAWYYMGKAYHLNYQFRESIQAYETFLRKADPKIAVKTDAQREIETCIYGSNLLANIKDITVLNKTEADRESFFRYFNLDAIGGKILTLPDELKTKLDEKAEQPGVIHYPGNSTTIYFSSYGKDGKTGKDIYKAQILPDGKFSEAVLLQGDVNSKYDEDYCFMHSDGKTLYFASKGHNSMGGYDIFKCVYDPANDTFGPAINLDFAINTPDDDIFFIADSLNQRAYFASGRTSDQKHLHVYNVMVETTPLKIIYLKGDFISEINADQKKATIKINDQMSSRAIMEGSTNQSNGSYVLYVPGAGEYSFRVVTENSPTVHEVKVNIPSFDKPVALRQEMRLINDGGSDKLIVTNYFETPLAEDLAALAADMLRKKAGLEVNASGEQLAGTTKTQESTYSLEKTMENAPLAAGFADGITVKSIVTGMEEEASAIRRFVTESGQKQASSYAYALKKQKEAETALAKAEQLRSTTSTYATQTDVDKLRESVALTSKARELQREANAALAAAQTVNQYKDSEATRAGALEEQVKTLKQAESKGDFDVAVATLNTEKQRQSAMRNGGITPHAELVAKAKAKESEQQAAEQKISKLREDEKDLTEDLAAAENKKNTATKKSDKQAAETEYVNIKSSLDNVRKSIVEQNKAVDKLGDEAKDAYADAAVFKRVSDDTSMGLASSEQVAMNDADKTKLEMKLKEMNSRVNALEVTDPQMLALITDASMENYTAEARTASNMQTMYTRNATSISGDHDALLAKTGTKPEMAPARRMFIANSLAETTGTIRQLELRKKEGALTAQEQEELKSLVTLRTQLQAEMAATNPATPVLSNEDLRTTYMSVSPDFNDRVAAINNSSGNEIERTVKIVEYKEETLEKLRTARYNNAEQAAVETDQSALAAMAVRDQQYEAAIRQLESNTTDVNQFKAAYETENKSIIESDAVFAGKLQDQISITQSYVDALGEIESEKQKQLELTTDPQEAATLRTQMEEIRKEKKAAEAKLENYRNDLSLTAATSDPAIDSTAVALNTTPVSHHTVGGAASLEDEIEKVEKSWDFSAPRAGKAEGDPEKSQAQLDTDKVIKIFKPREQSESIFAYESAAFEEIVSQHTGPGTELKHREKIQAINDEIFLVEAEMENEKSEAKLRKLDYRAEQLYLRRSLIEIDNSSAIAQMSQEEYEEEKKKATEMTAANREKIDGRQMIKDHVEQLERQAKSNMQEAATLREIAPSKLDDIERADYYREAFAKEALAIDELQQIQAINENIDMLLSYDEKQLSDMRTGKSPDADLAAALLAEKAAQAAAEEAEAKVKDVEGSETTAMNGNTGETVNGTTTEGGSATGTEKATNDASALNNTAGNTATGNKPDGTAKSTTNKTDDAGNGSTAMNPTSKNNTSTGAGSEKSATMTSRSTESGAAASTAAGATAGAGAYTAAEAGTYYFEAPEVLEKDLFVKTTRGVYSENKPIPMDEEMPKGVYYKIQVGAFRNKIPQNLYDEFAPISGETMKNGVVRYSAGFFKSFDNADQAKKDIRTMGYSDAFVVAYRDGKRIPLYEAMGKTAEDFQANIEKEYVYGDKGEAPKSRIAPEPKVVLNTESKSATKATYYNGFPDAAKAAQVENIQGLFFTVQVGVYSRPVPPKSVYYINPLNTELTENKRIRYTAGRYTSLNDAVDKRAEAKALGIKDAFITAYYNGERITLSDADKLLKENGPAILTKE